MTPQPLRSPLRSALLAQLAASQGAAALHLRLAGPDDLDLIDALNARVVADLPAGGMFMRQDAAFFAALLHKGGEIILGFAQDRLASYSVVALANDQMTPFAPAPGPVGLLFGTAIDPALRGHGLQGQMIQLRCAALAEAGCVRIQSTVAPSNHRSVYNLVAAGFEVAALRSLLDGHPRFVVERILTAADPAPVAAHSLEPELLPPQGSNRGHSDRLAAGMRGIMAVLDPCPAILYNAGQRSDIGASS